MTYYLTWSSTGDSLPFNENNSEFVEWYISELGSNNQFNCTSRANIPNMICELNDSLNIINQFFLDKFKIKFSNDDVCLNSQQVLNDLHKAWVLVQRKNTGLLDLLLQIDKNVFDKFVNINELIHKIEQAWSFEFNNYKDKVWQADNIWGTKFCSFERCNIKLEYGNLGRSSMEKYLAFDNTPNDNELNHFEKISGNLIVNFNRTEKITPSPEYINWCIKLKIPQYFNCVNIGNFIDLEKNLDYYRQIFLKNVQLSNNYLRITNQGN